MFLAAFSIFASLANYKTNAHDYEECASAAQVATLDDIQFNSALDPNYKAKQSKQNTQHIASKISCSDLSAQWAMSDIAMMGYIAGLFGLLFLGITVFETNNTAQAARDALEVTRRVGEAQTRAIVGVEMYNWTRNPNGHIVQPSIKNFGHTYAEDVVFYANKAVVFDISEIDFTETSAQGIYQNAGVVAPQNHDHGLGAQFFHSDFEDQRKIVLIYGFIEYTTLGKRRITRFCERLIGIGSSCRASVHNCVDERAENQYGPANSIEQRRENHTNWV